MPRTANDDKLSAALDVAAAGFRTALIGAALRWRPERQGLRSRLDEAEVAAALSLRGRESVARRLGVAGGDRVAPARPRLTLRQTRKLRSPKARGSVRASDSRVHPALRHRAVYSSALRRLLQAPASVHPALRTPAE